jgi:hypothetical protein
VQRKHTQDPLRAEQRPRLIALAATVGSTWAAAKELNVPYRTAKTWVADAAASADPERQLTSAQRKRLERAKKAGRMPPELKPTPPTAQSVVAEPPGFPTAPSAAAPAIQTAELQHAAKVESRYTITAEHREQARQDAERIFSRLAEGARPSPEQQARQTIEQMAWMAILSEIVRKLPESTPDQLAKLMDKLGDKICAFYVLKMPRHELDQLGLIPQAAKQLGPATQPENADFEPLDLPEP